MADFDPVCSQPSTSYYDYTPPVEDDVVAPPAAADTSETETLQIDQHLYFDVNLLTNASLSPNEAANLGKSVPPDTQAKLDAARDHTSHKWGVVQQVRSASPVQIDTEVLVEPQFKAAGSNWAIEAGGITAETVKVSGLTEWWVIDPPNVLWLAADYRVKSGLAYANAEVRDPTLGTVRAGLSSSAQLSMWGTAIATPDQWSLSGFVSGEAIAAKGNVQYETPKIAVPGTVGMVNLQGKVSLDLNVGGVGGALGAGLAGSMHEPKVQAQVVVGLVPGVGWRGLGVFDLSINTEATQRVSQGIDADYESSPVTQDLREIAQSDTASVQTQRDMSLALGGSYAYSAVKVLGPQVVDDLKKAGDTVVDTLGPPLAQLGSEIAEKHEQSPGRQAMDDAISQGALLGSGVDPMAVQGGMYLSTALGVVWDKVSDFVGEVVDTVKSAADGNDGTPTAQK